MEEPKEPGEFSIPRESWVVVAVLLVLGIGAVVWFWRRSYEHPHSSSFLGPEACRKCHEDIFEDWSSTRMARTFDVLRPGHAVQAKLIANLDPEADFTHDDACLPCHTTGYGLSSGFQTIEKTPHLAGVTCEACHGPGGTYVGAPMSKDSPDFRTSDATAKGLVYPPTEAVCRRCHNEKSPFVGSDYVFDYGDRVKRGTHEHKPLRYRHEGGTTP